MLVDTTKDFPTPIELGMKKKYSTGQKWLKGEVKRQVWGPNDPKWAVTKSLVFVVYMGTPNDIGILASQFGFLSTNRQNGVFERCSKRFLMESLRILKAINSSFRLWISPCRFWQVVTLILGGFDFEVKGISTWFDVKASGAFFWKENVDLSSFKKTHALCPRFLDMLICLMIFFTDELLSVQHHEKALFRGSYILWFPFSASQNRRRISWITNLLLQLIDFFLECPWY